MPKEMERKLRKQAEKKGLTGDRKNAYIYGTMQEKTDWKPNQNKPKRMKSGGMTKKSKGGRGISW